MDLSLLDPAPTTNAKPIGFAPPLRRASVASVWFTQGINRVRGVAPPNIGCSQGAWRSMAELSTLSALS